MSDRLEEGKYYCRVSGQELRQSKKGNWMVVLKIEPMLFEPRGGTETTAVEFAGTRTYYGTLTKKSVQIVQKELEALGFKSDKPSDIHHAKGGANLVGNEAWWILSYQDAQDGGTPFEKWRVFTPRESAAPIAISEGDLMQIDALFGDAFAGEESPAAAATEGEWNEL